MKDVTRGQWADFFRVLRDDDPSFVDGLITDFPEFTASMRSERMYGDWDGVPTRLGQLAHKVADKGFVAINRTLREVSVAVEARSLLLRRLKFAGGIVSALGAGSAVGVLLGGTSPSLVPIAAAAIGLSGAVLNLYATYVDEASGGLGSIAELREKLAVHRRSVTLLQGQYQLAKLECTEEKIIEVVSQLNIVAADVEFARARLGLA